MTLRSGLNPKAGQSYEKIAEKLQKNLEVKKKCVPLQSQTIRTTFETTNSRIAQLVRASDC